MIGRGILAIKKNDKYELHFMSPWNLAVSKQHYKDNMCEFDKLVLEQVKEWKPDLEVDEEEYLKIKESSQDGDPNNKNYHKYAADIIYLIET